MAIIAKSTAKKILAPSGTHIARCFQMIEIGTIKEEYQGSIKEQKKVLIGWELPNEMAVFNPEKGEQPHVISKMFTLSMHEKSNLRKVLEGWRGKTFSEDEAKNFDITKLIGIPCMLTVAHNEKEGTVHANISSVGKFMKGIECPPQINNSFILSYDNFDEALFNSLPDWIRDKMKATPEYIDMFSHGETHDSSDQTNNLENLSPDDLPF